MPSAKSYNARRRANPPVPNQPLTPTNTEAGGGTHKAFGVF